VPVLTRSLRLALAVAAAVLVAPLAASPAAADLAPADYADATVSSATVTVPMTFPVIGGTSYSDTYLACRSGCARRHFGQDLMGAKMRPAVAVFNGYVHSIKKESYVGEGNYITLQGDNGWSANYIHMNNDTPGTDDGKGTAQYFLAPGIHEGKRVFAGQLLGWTGDSGNAESTGPHLHFELRKGDPWGGVVYNAFASLNAGRRLTRPVTSGPHHEGTFVKGCSTCSTWELDAGKRRLVLPEVGAQIGLDPRSVVTITQNEARWYRRGADVQLPGGRAYKGPDGKVWFVTGGVRYAVPGTAALTALGIKSTRVRAMTAAGLATVPLAPEGSVLPTGLFYGGALLRVPGSTTSYWYLRSGQRHLVNDAFTLRSWGLSDLDAITLPEVAEGEAPLVLPALGDAVRIKDGLVVKSEAGRRYLVTGGQKRPFGSWPLYVSYGFEPVLQQVPPVSALYRLPTGTTLP
jgi:murein DD-endopeptidase MepM/ murein hydrolase activator NlpD